MKKANEPNEAKKGSLEDLYQTLKGEGREYGSLKGFERFVNKETRKQKWLALFKPGTEAVSAILVEANIVKELLRLEVKEYTNAPNQILREDGIAKTAVVQLAYDTGFINDDVVKEFSELQVGEGVNQNELRDNVMLLIDKMPKELAVALAPIAIYAQQNTEKLDKIDISEECKYTPDQTNKLVFVGNQVFFNAVIGPIAQKIGDQSKETGNTLNSEYVEGVTFKDALKKTGVVKAFVKDDPELNAFIFSKVQQAHNQQFGYQASSTPEVGQIQERLKTIGQASGQKIVHNVQVQNMLRNRHGDESGDLARSIEQMSKIVDQLHDSFDPGRADKLAEAIKSISEGVVPNTSEAEQLATVKNNFSKTIVAAVSDGIITQTTKEDLLDKVGAGKGKEDNYTHGAPRMGSSHE
jgi:hypothetical protein